MKLENQMVNYSANNDSITTAGSSGSDGYTLSWNWYQDYWYPYYQHSPYYVSYPVYITEKDKFEKSFRIAKLLLKKKLLKSRKLKDFIGLVEEIAKEL